MLACAAGTLAQAQSDCGPGSWDGCLGKPWVDGDTMETPIGSAWWPNPLWGGEDEAGSTNWYTQPEVLQRALSASTGEKVYRLGHAYSPDMPFFGARSFVMRVPGMPTIGASGANGFVYNDDYVAGELGQIGTQFDGLAHSGIQIGEAGDLNETRFYNGFTSAEMWDGGKGSYGLQKLGIEKLHPIVARGVLLDVAAAKGGPLPDGYEITMADIRDTLAAQDMAEFEFQPGDALLFRTGWERHWTDAESYGGHSPGIGMEVARWVAEEVQAGLTGADNLAIEAYPSSDPDCSVCVHSFLQTRHGIVAQESMVLSELSEDRTYVFTYIFSPVPFAGATGSPGTPLAIK
ncbi:cyclase family protein [Mangrovicoccus ximenensis]|uniref:cyclase family protein n=1 Tax=Mangrovicoccus ximenensis TaxID=1911570 RepID=UPI000D35463A|nr:cyclase family protein [Mangrovicoccus ximenensis]